MVNNIGKEQLDSVASLEMGSMGTRKWERGEIAWAANSGMMVITANLILAGFIYFQFVLVPLITSYFLVFLVAPVMDVFEFRPMSCGCAAVAVLSSFPVPKELCCIWWLTLGVCERSQKNQFCDLTEPDPDADPNEDPDARRYKSEFRRSVKGKPQGGLYDCFTTCKLPHGMTILMTLVVVFGGMFALGTLIWGEVSVLLADEEFVQELADFVDSIYDSLNASGVKIFRETTEGYTSDEISGIVGAFGGFFNSAALIFLLWVYLLAEKTDRRMFGDTNQILVEIENQVTNYIALKTVLSFVTGIVVGTILLIIGVKLAVMFGLLSFVLNYIPNVGSMIAMFLPMPLVIVDKGLSTGEKIAAFVGPGAVQGYVGNALEPMVFGKSLNMTPLSILMALVLWSSLWGLMGAILSVPMLGIQKICFSHANHPMAKYFITLIREDPTVDGAFFSAVLVCLLSLFYFYTF